MSPRPSGPLSDRVRARLSLTSNHHDGYIDNDLGRDLGGSKFYGGRFQVEADVGDSGKLLLKLQGLRNDHESSGGAYTHVSAGFDVDGLGFELAPTDDFWGTCSGCDAVGYKDPDNDPHTASFDLKTDFNRTYWSATLRYDHDFGDISFVSLTDYQDLDKRYSEDTDMTPLPIFDYFVSQDLYQISQEFRLTGASGRLNWVVGGYGLKLNSDFDYKDDLSQSLGLITRFGGRQKTDSLATFGQVEYKIIDQISMILGARYSWDWKTLDFKHVQSYVDGTADDIFFFNKTVTPTLVDRKFYNYSFKGEVDLRPNDDMLVYFSINRGTKSGGFGLQSFQPIKANAIPFGEEILTNYEAGFKLSLANRSINLNGVVFYYDYDDYQAFSVDGFSQFITNNPVEVQGFEIELVARPIRGLTIQGFLTHLDSQLQGITLPFGRVADRVLPQAPSWSVGGMFRYRFAIGPGAVTLQTDWKYDSAQYFSTFNAPIDRESKRVIGNARIAFDTADEHWTVAAFVNNLTNKKYRVYNLDLGAILGTANQTYARPRWIGGSVGYSF